TVNWFNWFPSSAWEPKWGSSASRLNLAAKRSFAACVPKQSLGTRAKESRSPSLFPAFRYRAAGRFPAMRRAVWFSSWVVCVAGCLSANEERLQEYNNDGIFLFQKGDFGDARLSFQAALELKPED